MIKVSENKKCYAEEKQRNILLKLISHKIIEDSFFLTGGTALSVFYLHHRHSNDLDFFSKTALDLSEIGFILKIQWNAEYLKIKESVNFLSLLIDDIKVDFVIDKLSNDEHRERLKFENNHSLLIDNVKNIISNKFCTLVSRSEPKDFVDFYYLNSVLPDIDFNDLYYNSSLKDGIFDDPPTAAYQIEENIKFIKNNPKIFPQILIEFNREEFYFTNISFRRSIKSLHCKF